MLNRAPTPNDALKNKEQIIKYIQKSMLIQNNSKICTLLPQSFAIDKAIAIQTTFILKCKQNIQNLQMRFNLFFEFDKTQQGVMQILTPDDEKLFIFSPHQQSYQLTLNTPPKPQSFKNFIIEGVWHIWEGIDHILFLLMLLVPSVLLKKNFKKTLLEILKIVTAFTLSHSFTLSLSMFNILNPPEQLIETLIALTVLFTALNNIFKLIAINKNWLLAFGFGFIHGFGFANALHEMQLSSTHFASAVFGFNIGIEIGQVVIVLFLLPLLFTLGKREFYARKFVPLISSAVAAVALLWAVDRAFVLHFMPF